MSGLPRGRPHPSGGRSGRGGGVVNGKPRGRVLVAAGANEAGHEAAARADAKVAALLDGATVRKVVVVPGRMVDFVIG